MRTVGTAVAMIAQWLGVYLVVVVTPVGVANIGWRFYIVFAVLNVAFIPFIIYFYVETAGLSLEEVDRVFELKYGRDDGVKISYDEAIAEVNLERRIRTSENAKEGLENLEKAELEIEEAVVKS